MLFAQIPNPEFSPFGGWMISLAMFILILDRGSSFVERLRNWGKKKEDTPVAVDVSKLIEVTDKFVELADFKEMKAQLGSYATRFEISRVEEQISSLTASQKELSKYTQDQVTKLTEATHRVEVGVERMHREVSENIHAAFGKTMSVLDRINSRVSTHEAQIDELGKTSE